MTTTDILTALNDYQGDNIWQDVIYDILTGEEWDAAADGSDEFSHDGTTYRYEPTASAWIAR